MWLAYIDKSICGHNDFLYLIDSITWGGTFSSSFLSFILNNSYVLLSSKRGRLLAQGYNHQFLVLMITKYIWLFSIDQVQVFKCVSEFKKIQEVFSSKGRYMKTQDYPRRDWISNALDITIGEAFLKTFVVVLSLIRKEYV